MESKKQTSTGIVVLITILVIAVIGLTSFIVYDKVIKKDEVKEPTIRENKTSNDENNGETNKVSFIDYQYDNFKINMINQVDNVDDIYAVDIMYNEQYSNQAGSQHYDLVIRYKDESKLKIATIYQTNSEVSFEYRTLDIDNNKIYFYVTGINNTIFELYFIDLNDMGKKPQNISKFDEINKEENNYCFTTYCVTYPTKIFVNNDIIYFVSKKNGIMSYNIKMDQLNTIVSDSKDWFNIFVDKINNKIVYSSGQDFNIINIDGTKNSIVDGKIINSSSQWKNGYYNGFPVFTSSYDENGNTAECYYGGPCYEYSYVLNTVTGQFQMIDIESIDSSSYDILYNSISSSKDEKIIYSYYVGKK